MFDKVKKFILGKSGLTAFEKAVIASVVIGAIVYTWNAYLKNPYYDTQQRIGDWMESGQDAGGN